MRHFLQERGSTTFRITADELECLECAERKIRDRSSVIRLAIKRYLEAVVKARKAG
jgi:hypothetical protein